MDITFTAEVEDWGPTARFKKTYVPPEGTLEETIELELTSEKELTRYSLEATSPFPPLDLSSTPQGKNSRENFYSKLQSWVGNLNLVPHAFRFDGTHEGMDFSIQKPHPSYSKPISLELNEVLGVPFPEKTTFEISYLWVRVRSGSLDFSLDIRNKLSLSSIAFPLPVSSSPVAPGTQHISLDGLERVSHWEGHSLNYTSPRIPGFKETPDEDTPVTYLHPSSSSSLYKNALAASVLLKEDLGTVPLFPQGASSQLDEDFEDDMTMVSMPESLASSSFSSSHMSSASAFSHSLYPNKKESVVYTLLGEEIRVESPYLYSDGHFMYLTQTFQQECGPQALKQASHILKYTTTLSFKVRIQSDDLRLEPPYILPLGLYTLEDGLWTKVDDRYLRPTAYNDYKALPPKPEGLARSIASFEQAHFPGLKEAYVFLGAIREFIQPDPSSIEDDELFQSYHRRIYSEGLLKTLTSIPEEHEHLITPLCLVVREDPTLNDPTLFRPESDFDNHYKFAASHGVCWGGTHRMPSSNLDLHRFLNQGCVYVAFPHSLIALCLFKSTDYGLRVIYGRWDHSKNGPVPNILSEKDYRNIARFLNLNQHEIFKLTPNYDYEPDDILTIATLAQALAHNTSLKNFEIPRYIGLANLTCLIREGMCFNTSIEETMLNQVCGDMPILLLGELLEKNTILKKVEIRFHHILDKESFNALGRGLSKNTTLAYISLDDCYEKSCSHTNPSPPCYQRPLPSRLIPTFVALTPFIQALISFKGELVFRTASHTLKDIAPKIKTERNKVGLKTTLPK